jgi:hypothetical protein
MFHLWRPLVLQPPLLDSGELRKGFQIKSPIRDFDSSDMSLYSWIRV